MDIITLYGIFAIATWGILSLLQSFVLTSKFWKKHLKTRKNIFFFLALFAIALFWIGLENGADDSTLQIFWAIHAVLFVVYAVWSAKKIYDDYSRIKSMEARRAK